MSIRIGGSFCKVAIGIVVVVVCGTNVVVVVCGANVVVVVVVVAARSDLWGSPVEEIIPDARMT